MLFAIGQIEFVNGHPELLSQKDLQHYTLEALHDIERGIAKLPAQEAQYFEQALAPLSDLHGSQAHIGDQHVAGPELVETVLNTFSHLFHLAPANCWPNTA